MAKEESKFLMYKNRPLVRCGDVLYYGNMYDKYVVMMRISSKRTIGDLEVATRVSVQMQSTDPNVRTKDRVLKTAEKMGLSSALEIASIWLDRA